MLEALIAGEHDPRVLADLAKAGLRRRTDALAEALTGNFTAHHAFLARAMLDRIDACTATEAKLSEHVEVMLQPFRRRIELLVTIPGVQVRAARVILAEIGADITRFPSAADLASWAGVCPGTTSPAAEAAAARPDTVTPGSRPLLVRPLSAPRGPRTRTSPHATDASSPVVVKNAPRSPSSTRC
jgi:transposase